VTRSRRRQGIHIALVLICLLLGCVGLLSSSAPSRASGAGIGELAYSYDPIHRPASPAARLQAAPQGLEPMSPAAHVRGMGDPSVRADAGVAAEGAVPRVVNLGGEVASREVV
jgi:hypothetical protein